MNQHILVKYRVALISLVLAAVTFIAFEQVRNNEFVYDDDQYIVNNPHVQMGITRESVVSVQFWIESARTLWRIYDDGVYSLDSLEAIGYFGPDAPNDN